MLIFESFFYQNNAGADSDRMSPKYNQNSKPYILHHDNGFYNTSPGDMVDTFETVGGVWKISVDSENVKFFLNEDIMHIPQGRGMDDDAGGEWYGMRAWPRHGPLEIALIRIYAGGTVCGNAGPENLFFYLIDFRPPGPPVASEDFGVCQDSPKVTFSGDRILIDLDGFPETGDGHLVWYKKHLYSHNEKLPKDDATPAAAGAK